MADWIFRHARKSLDRLLPRMQHRFQGDILSKPDRWKVFQHRLERHWDPLFRLLVRLYGGHYDFFYHLEEILAAAIRAGFDRPEPLARLDSLRESEPDWFLSQTMVGGVLYVDLFADNLAKLPEHIPYFKRLGLTYLHLMPLFLVPHGDNDGGYAVSDYRSVNPDIGSMPQLAELAKTLRAEGISLCLDFVFNHTSDEHDWAMRAKAGDPNYREYYYLFPDRTLPDQYEQYLRDIFPSVRKGSFTWHDGMQQWVWTTFNSYQWDLNYSNPAVFRRMAEEMLFLANQGVEILRLDAVAFIGKRLGTGCENLPEAHRIIRAFSRLARMASPGLIFKSEAIVHPAEVLGYIDADECPLSYNPQLMALLWEALATGEVRLLDRAMRHRGQLPPGCAWVNYLRCHDDIGWTFDDDDARAVGIDPAGHRRYLNRFYTGEHPYSFARGVPFQFNPATGDQRICGTLASLAGLEQALADEDPLGVEVAVNRINMLRSIILSIGGIPLIYLGEEWGELNDYTYLSDPAKALDNRWIHRAKKRWGSRRFDDPSTLEWRFFDMLVRLIRLRKAIPAFRNGGMEVVDTGNPHLFGFVRRAAHQRVLVVNNFSPHTQFMPQERLAACDCRGSVVDLISGGFASAAADLALGPYGFVWLECRPAAALENSEGSMGAR